MIQPLSFLENSIMIIRRAGFPQMNFALISYDYVA